MSYSWPFLEVTTSGDAHLSISFLQPVIVNPLSAAVLSAMAAINQAVDAGDVSTTFNRLSEDEALIINLDEGSRDKYQVALRELKKEKKHVSGNV